MKRILTSIIYSALAVIFAFGQVYKGNGNVVEQTRDVENFSKVSVSEGIKIVLTQASEEKLIVKTDENVQEAVKTEVNDGILKIHVKGTVRKVSELTVFLTFNNLSELNISEGVGASAKEQLTFDDIKINCSEGSALKLSLKAENIDLRANEGSSINIECETPSATLSASEGSSVKASLIADNIKCRAAEGSVVKLNGEGKLLELDAKEGCSINTSELKVADCNAFIKEGTVANIFASAGVNITASEGSVIRVKGNPSERNIKNNDKSCVINFN
ncbi:MAG: DUF2807 domain-containing protein [Bacteroidales bacterium]|nr:DUF2807 domain-containing protein [Bacteroidales bacterium]